MKHLNPLLNTPLPFAPPSQPIKVLPFGGDASYFGAVLDTATADLYLRRLLRDTPWRPDVRAMYGKLVSTARKVAWYGPKQAWPEDLRRLKEVAERRAGAKFNAVLLNLYADGKHGLAWHSDEEAMKDGRRTIGSLSLGAVRRFDFRHVSTGEKVSTWLEHGSLLVMRGRTQEFWQHQVPKQTRVLGPRINLTFRQS